MHIVRLSDRPDLIAPLAAAYEAEWPDWYGPGGPGDAVADLTARAVADALPLALVLLDGETAVGTLAITPEGPHGFDGGPWIGGGWVEPSRRGRGLGARLLAAAVEEARRLGIGRLRVATATAAPLMLRAGWTAEGQARGLALFAIEPGAVPGR